MFSRWSIRYKLLFCISLLFLIVATLAFGGFQGVYSYRRLARSVSQRASELPLSGDLTVGLADLERVLQLEIDDQLLSDSDPERASRVARQFKQEHARATTALQAYRQQLLAAHAAGNMLGDTKAELRIVNQVQSSLKRLEKVDLGPGWTSDSGQVRQLREDLRSINQRASSLPSHLQTRMHEFAGQVRTDYRTLIVMTWITSILTVLVLFQVLRLLSKWLLRPFQTLITGSRRVASGDFDHRIQLDTEDEVAELAAAMNAMTSNFQRIHDDLDQQVKQRTREVVRSEQLASVGFLAAGVAHEINNPLATIAWCAESLESRFLENNTATADSQQQDDDDQLVSQYLQRIQSEAFRCKGITERLLDFSRLGPVTRQATQLQQVVAEVVEMVKHLGTYRNKEVVFVEEDELVAMVNSQEMKQVVLNLVINALDSLDDGGIVWIDLSRQGRQAVLVVRDNGCGMTSDVLEQLFEPFFTRRRDGQGTGLGLSISYRIVTDHGGTITADSPGNGQGSVLKVCLPLAEEAHAQQQHARVA